ncbi:MAG: 2-phospho-L-lactate guanylyltransferase [Gordonia paraffinivorans]
MPVPATDAFTVVLAVKGLADAKSRLAPVLGTAERRDLVLAMLADTVDAARAAGARDVVVVTPDATVAAAAQAVGARAVADPSPGTRPGAPGPLNAALAHGVDTVRVAVPRADAVVLQADLPTLRSDSLRAAVLAARGLRRAVVPDRSGEGTAALVLADPTDRTILFGAGSSAAHRDSGALDLTDGDARWPDLRTDVDTVDDLAVARRLGVGVRTDRVLRRLEAPVCGR